MIMCDGFHSALIPEHDVIFLHQFSHMVSSHWIEISGSTHGIQSLALSEFDNQDSVACKKIIEKMNGIYHSVQKKKILKINWKGTYGNVCYEFMKETLTGEGVCVFAELQLSMEYV